MTYIDPKYDGLDMSYIELPIPRIGPFSRKLNNILTFFNTVSTQHHTDVVHKREFIILPYQAEQRNKILS